MLNCTTQNPNFHALKPIARFRYLGLIQENRSSKHCWQQHQPRQQTAHIWNHIEKQHTRRAHSKRNPWQPRGIGLRNRGVCLRLVSEVLLARASASFVCEVCSCLRLRDEQPKNPSPLNSRVSTGSISSRCTWQSPARKDCLDESLLMRFAMWMRFVVDVDRCNYEASVNSGSAHLTVSACGRLDVKARAGARW